MARCFRFVMASFDRWRVSFEDLAGSSACRQVPNPPGFSTQTLKEAVFRIPALL